MNLLIVGAPGTGKGTMSELLIKAYDFSHISTGDMLRSAISAKSPLGLKAQSYMDEGKLVPDDLIHDLIVERLSQDDIKKGFLLDGYPRTLAQAEDLDHILKRLGLKIDAVIDLNVDEEVLSKRITGRRVCKDCGSIFHIDTHPSQKEGVCDNCGGELYQRHDDTLESLKTRLDAYHQSTQKVVDYYLEKGLVHMIDANDKPEAVFEKIQEVLKGLS